MLAVIYLEYYQFFIIIFDVAFSKPNLVPLAFINFLTLLLHVSFQFSFVDFFVVYLGFSVPLVFLMLRNHKTQNCVKCFENLKEVEHLRLKHLFLN